MATYLQHVRLMGQLRGCCKLAPSGAAREKEREREGEGGSQLVSCRAWLIFHNFHTCHKQRGGNGAAGSAAAARKTKYNKTYDFRLEWGKRQALEVVLTIANARSQLN